jgi:hypothetical protein
MRNGCLCVREGFVENAQDDHEIGDSLGHIVMRLKQFPRVRETFGQNARIVFMERHDSPVARATWEKAVLEVTAKKSRHV